MNTAPTVLAAASLDAAAFTDLARQAWLFAPRLLSALVLLLVVRLIARGVAALIRRTSEHAPSGRQDVLNLGAQTANIVITLFGAITALGTLGIDISALVAGLGLTGFALGFALRDALSNALAGVMVLFYHPFQRGDRVAMGPIEGIVTQIDLRYVTLRTEDRDLLIPNSTLLTQPLAVIGGTKATPVIITPDEVSGGVGVASAAR